jgi:cytochrome c-type biogenesis protein CcmF
MAYWIVASTVADVYGQIHAPGASLRAALARLARIPKAQAGMWVAHLGVAVFCFGVVMVRTYEVEKDVQMQIGDRTSLKGYTFVFRGTREVQGPNYSALRGLVDVSEGDGVRTMQPEKRSYRVQQNPMTEAAIDAGVTRDLYVSLGEQLDSGAWILRFYVKPFVNWIWFGCLLMALGGLLAVSDKRYRKARKPASGVEGAP